MIEAGFFVSFGIASDIRWSSRHEQPFDVRDRGEGAGCGSHPSFLRRGVAFIDQTLDVNLAERDVSVLIDAGYRDGAGGDHGSSRQLTLFFEVLDHLVKSSRGNTSWHPAIAVVRRPPAGSRCATAVPNRNVLARRRFELNVFEIVIVVFVADLFTGPESAAELGVDFRYVSAILQSGLFITCRFEFMGKGAEAKTHDDIAVAQRAEARHGLRQMNRMSVRDHRTGAESQFFADRGDSRENQQPLDVGIVFALHSVRFEDQMVPDPNRVKSISLGLL
jgi:hypothetical protein